MGFDWTGLITKGIGVTIIGGIMAYVLAMVTGMMTAIPLWGAVSILIAVILAVLLAKFGEVDDYNLFEFVILLGVVAFIGTVVTTLVPMAAPFILSVGAFTVGGLVWTFVYILLAEMILGKMF